MSLVTVRILRCIHDSPEYGSTDERMGSRIFLSILVDGLPQGEFHCDVTQAVGNPEAVKVGRTGRRYGGLPEGEVTGRGDDAVHDV